MSAAPLSNFNRLKFNDQLSLMLSRWLLPAILLLALALRLYMLEQKSFWVDELDQILYGQGSLAFTLSSPTPPIDYLVTHFVVHYIGQSEGIVRLPDVLWGVLTVLVVYRLGCLLFDRPVGYLAAFLLAILPIHIQYSQEARFYSLPTLLFSLCVYAAVRALDQPTRTGWLRYGVVCLLALFTQLYAIPVLGLLGLWVLLIRRPPRLTLFTFVGVTVIPVAVFGLWFLSVRSIYSYSRNVYTIPTLTDVVSSPFLDGVNGYNTPTYNSSTSSDPFHQETEVLLGIVTQLAALYWTFLLGALYLTFRRKLSVPYKRTSLGLVTLLGLGGIGSVLLVNVLSQYFFSPRQFVFFTPMFVLSIAAAYFTTVQLLSKLWVKKLSLARSIYGATAVMVLLSIIVLWQPLVDHYEALKQDWRGLSRYLLENVGANDALVSPYSAYVTFYSPELMSKVPPGMFQDVNGILSRTHPTMPQDAGTLAALAVHHPVIWIVLVSGPRFQQPPGVTDWIAANHLSPIRFAVGLEVYRYPSIAGS